MLVFSTAEIVRQINFEACLRAENLSQYWLLRELGEAAFLPLLEFGALDRRAA